MHRFARFAPPHPAGHRPGQIAGLHVAFGAGPRGHHRIVVERHGSGCADGLCADHAQELRAAPTEQLERLLVALLREALETPAARAAAAAAPAGADQAEADDSNADGHAPEPLEDFAGEF